MKLISDSADLEVVLITEDGRGIPLCSGKKSLAESWLGLCRKQKAAGKYAQTHQVPRRFARRVEDPLGWSIARFKLRDHTDELDRTSTQRLVNNPTGSLCDAGQYSITA